MILLQLKMIYTYGDINDIEKYHDGNYHENLLLVLRHLDPNNSSKYRNWIMVDGGSGNDNSYEKCVCSHWIRNYHIATHHITKDKIIVGSSCIHLFNSEYKKKTSRAIAMLKNPHDKYCPRCDRKVSGGVVEQYPNEKNIYHKKCWKIKESEEFDNMLVKCKWCNIKFKRKDLDEHLITHQKEIKKYEIQLQIKNMRNHKITFGKYKGIKMKIILANDRGYIQWLARDSYSDHIKDMTKLLLRIKVK